MAKRLDKFPTEARGGRIAQDKWFDGSIWELSPEEVSEYKDITTCRTALYQLARRRGWKGVKTRVITNDDGSKGLAFQCRTLDPNYWADAKLERQTSDHQLWEDCEMQVHKFKPNVELTDWLFIKDVCSLFDEQIESGNLFIGPSGFVGKREEFRNNQWIPHETDSNV